MQCRKLDEEKAKLIFSEQAGPPIQKATAQALLDIFFAWFEEADTGLKSISYFFSEGVLMEMAWKGSFHDTFEGNLECWTQ